jgi:tetratricopeptide (TPR) repeat protein
MNPESSVRAWEESVTIPTYPALAADPNPMFFEKRVYQGSSGKVYPNPFTDRVSNEKIDREYCAVFLENEYIKLMILPEIGGRIHMGVDKTNGYDFFYRQRVIKPALVGLLGPWISGGVEFNWPQHHRPSTFMPVDHRIEEQGDGSRTVWLSEHEPMNRMKGMVGICLYPGRALVEAKVQLYNCTPFVQSFLWWANVAVHVHERYQAFFPPDVTYVADHAKRAVSEFPIARGFYYGVDYTKGVDIRWYKNIPVPTSYMVTESRYDFFGGYDHARRAGIVHVADHHIAPGKKLWTWGNAEFGYAWDRELTDSDGPYIELMAGVYTDNQPDFSWLQPYETKTFHQYWYPIQQIGAARNANRHAAVNLEVLGDRAHVGVCCTADFRQSQVLLYGGEETILERIVDLAPGRPMLETVNLPHGVREPSLLLLVRTQDGTELIRCRPESSRERPLPAPATEPPPPAKITTGEELYLTGLHLEQYRHATRYPEAYWQEGLLRDPDDVRNNNALGLLYLRRGQFEEAEQHFRRAIGRLTKRNPNPYDGEPYYNLGLALRLHGCSDEAYQAFSKAVWNYSWQAAGSYALAEIDCRRRDYLLALEHLDLSLATNAVNLKARNLKTSILRRLGRIEQAEATGQETVRLDPLDFWCRNEIVLACRARRDSDRAESLLQELRSLMRGQSQTYLDLAFDYSAAGLREEACDLLERLYSPNQTPVAAHPMVVYTLGYFAEQARDVERAKELYRNAGTMPSDYCFPSRLEEMLVLEAAEAADPENAKAFCYLGNLLYDKKRYEEAVAQWQRSCELDPDFSIPWRNLGIAYCNVRHDARKAVVAYRKAFEVNPRDARLLYEMDQLEKRLGTPPGERLEFLEGHLDLVEWRDDLAIERITLCNETGKPHKALDLLLSRRFHPWEGGESLVSGQYVWAHAILGRHCLEIGKPGDALAHFLASQHYPENLGEGRHVLTPQNHLHYFAGLAQEALGDREGARQSFRKATEGRGEHSAMTYYQALALKKLGQEEAGAAKLRALLNFASRQMEAKIAIDHFTTSLPNFLVFEDDLDARNRTDSLFLKALAQLGLGQPGDAGRAFREVLSLDPNHLGAQQELQRLVSSGAYHGEH